MLEYSYDWPRNRLSCLVTVTYIRSHHNALPAPAHAVRARRPAGDSDPAPSEAGSAKTRKSSKKEEQKKKTEITTFPTSVEELAALLGPAVARQLAAGVLDGEFVVVGELLATVDAARGEDDDVFLLVHGDDPRVAAGLTGVVDEARGVAVHRGVHHLVVVDAEHVAADALRRRRWGGG